MNCGLRGLDWLIGKTSYLGRCFGTGTSYPEAVSMRGFEYCIENANSQMGDLLWCVDQVRTGTGCFQKSLQSSICMIWSGFALILILFMKNIEHCYWSSIFCH